MDTVAQSKTLYIFTNEYPYGQGESFIENELIVLAEKYKHIYLFPLKKSGEPRPLPVSSIKVIYLFEKNEIRKWQLFFSDFFLILCIFFLEFKQLSFSKFIKSIPLLKSILLTNIYRAKILTRYMRTQSENDVVFYSFWTDDWATVLSLLTYGKRIHSFVSRVHGYDLYQERWPNELIPFRNFQLKYVAKVITASVDGLHYMQKHYPKYRHKFVMQHLNVLDNGTNPFFEDDEFVIVSCARITPLKRIHAIPTLLEQLEFKIRWIHFGDGEGMDDLRKSVSQLPSHIAVELKGYVHSDVLTQFYRTKKVNLFIHLSETEGGVPLVLQEAASFGIPLLGTDAGGIREIVTPQTGILIPVNFNEKDVLEKIIKMHSPVYNNAAFRKNVKQYWAEHFNSTKNIRKLI